MGISLAKISEPVVLGSDGWNITGFTNSTPGYENLKYFMDSFSYLGLVPMFPDLEQVRETLVHFVSLILAVYKW